MKSKLSYCLLLTATMMSSCNDSSFNGSAKKKEKENPALANPKEDDAIPNEVNCTGLSEEKCEELKPSPDTKTFREIDCAGKTVDQCEKAKEDERQKDGDLGSEIRVKNDEEHVDIEDGEEEVVKKGRFYCIGGLGLNVSYVVKTKELAQKCLAFGNARPCQNDPKCDENAPLIVFDCECSNEAGIPFVKTNQCYRTNPLKGGIRATGCIAK